MIFNQMKADFFCILVMGAFCICPCFKLFSAPSSGVEAIEQLIASTQTRLEEERHLRRLLIQVQEEKEKFIKGEQTRACAARLSAAAQGAIQKIEQEHLHHLFSSEYMEELQFFSSIGDRHVLKKP